MPMGQDFLQTYSLLLHIRREYLECPCNFGMSKLTRTLRFSVVITYVKSVLLAVILFHIDNKIYPYNFNVTKLINTDFLGLGAAHKRCFDVYEYHTYFEKIMSQLILT